MDKEKLNCCDDNEENCCAHDDNHDCGCGCGDHADVINLQFENGEEKECLILGIVEVEGQDYIALLPKGEEEYFVYRYEEIEDGLNLTSLKTDEEFDKVGKVFQNIFDGDYEEVE